MNVKDKLIHHILYILSNLLVSEAISILNGRQSSKYLKFPCFQEETLLGKLFLEPMILYQHHWS